MYTLAHRVVEFLGRQWPARSPSLGAEVGERRKRPCASRAECQSRVVKALGRQHVERSRALAGIEQHRASAPRATPVGGADKVPTFVALIGAQTNLNVAVLVDYQKKDKQAIEDLYKRKLLKKQSVLTYADYVDATEADIEDMFTPDFYLKLVNGEYGSSIGVSDIQTKHSRILCRLERHIDAHPLPQGAKFNHYRPARYFSDNISSLGHEISDQEFGRFERIFGALNKLL